MPIYNCINSKTYFVLFDQGFSSLKKSCTICYICNIIDAFIQLVVELVSDALFSHALDNIEARKEPPDYPRHKQKPTPHEI